jgi:hypothetical protein
MIDNCIDKAMKEIYHTRLRKMQIPIVFTWLFKSARRNVGGTLYRPLRGYLMLGNTIETLVTSLACGK